MSSPKVWCGALILAGAAWWMSLNAIAQTPGSDAKPLRWEYITEVVDANALQAKLTEWSQANWELVAVNSAISAVDPGEKPVLRVERYLLTAKRPLK